MVCLFYPFRFDEDGVASPEVDVGGCQVAEALVVAQVIVVGDWAGARFLETADCG